jgi:hypothetical protein
MIILTYLNKLLISLQDENIPQEGKLALALFILSVILFVSFSNIMIYFIILLGFENKIIQDWVDKWKFLIKFISIYKKTRIGFLLFEICLSLYIIIFIIYYSYKVYNFYLLT